MKTITIGTLVCSLFMFQPSTPLDFQQLLSWCAFGVGTAKTGQALYTMRDKEWFKQANSDYASHSSWSEHCSATTHARTLLSLKKHAYIGALISTVGSFDLLRHIIPTEYAFLGAALFGGAISAATYCAKEPADILDEND